MEKSLVVSIVLFAVFIIPEISCENTKCLEFKQQCFKDSECCSSNCVYASDLDNSYCMEAKNSVLNEPKTENGMCSYNASFYKGEDRETYKRFGISVAHSLLQPFSKILLKYNNNTLEVTINDLQTKPGILLELSREAALMLGIEKEGSFPCSITLLDVETSHVSLKKIITVTVSFFLVVLLVVNFF